MNMALYGLVLFFVVGNSMCAVYSDTKEADCNAIVDCETCTNRVSWIGLRCRWCPLTRECHTFGSLLNHCLWNQDIMLPKHCSPKSYGHYDPEIAFEQALFSTAAYSADPQTCLDQMMPSNGFQVVDIMYGNCEYLFEYEDCFAYTAVSLEKKIVLLAFRGTEEWAQLTEQSFLTLFKRKVPFRTGGRVQKYFRNAFNALYPCVYGSVGGLVKKYPDFDVQITGHSLGGAVASLSSAALVHDKVVRQTRMSLYTYGMPRVGDKEYAANHDRLVNNSWRVVHYKDPVSHLPMCNVFTGCGLTDGPYHHRTEVYYPSPDMTQNSEYIICKGNEDNNCSNGAVSEDTCLPNISECMDYHQNYFGIPIGTYCQQSGKSTGYNIKLKDFRKIDTWTCQRLAKKSIYDKAYEINGLNQQDSSGAL